MVLLLLTGTREAADLARALRAQPGAPALVLADSGNMRGGAAGADLTLSGDWGSDRHLADDLRARGVTRIIDGSHPFEAARAAQMARVASLAGLPYLRLLRPAWRPRPGDRWHDIGDESAAAGLVPPGARVFVTTGRDHLARYAALCDCTLFVRQLGADRGPFPLPRGRFVPGTPPFTVADEIALFRDLRIDWLVVRNAGGDGNTSKLDAARHLGLDVAMIRRPDPPPDVARAADTGAALQWLKGQGK